MDGNTREFGGMVTAAEFGTVFWSMAGDMVGTDAVNTVKLSGADGGDCFGVRLADSMEDARELVGRRVRVTVEVLDG